MPSTLHLTLAEYDAMVLCGAFDTLDRKVELIEGELVEMNPAGPLHDFLITYLTDWSVRQSDENRTMVTSQTGLTLPEQGSRVEPDLMWLHKGNFRHAHPLPTEVQLAIEVAYSSLTHDLEKKRLLYAAAGIVEYWIVDAAASCIHVHLDPSNGDYQTRQVFKPGEPLAPTIAPGAKLDLHDLFGN